jgi:hypothetical protein
LITHRTNDLSDRRNAAVNARAALLQSCRATREAAEPTRLARQEERLALAKARDERHAARDRAKHEERQCQIDLTRIETETAREILAEAELAEREAALASVDRVIKHEAARKAERDLRYANRKARQK